MKTKEAMILPFADKNNPGYYHECNVEELMDEYAKETALDYAHWLLQRMFPYNVEGFRPNPEAENLYNIYQQEKNK